MKCFAINNFTTNERQTKKKSNNNRRAKRRCEHIDQRSPVQAISKENGKLHERETLYIGLFCNNIIDEVNVLVKYRLIC